MLTCTDTAAGERLLDRCPVDLSGRLFCVCLREIIPVLYERYHLTEARGCYQAYYTQGVPLTVPKDFNIRRLDVSFAEEIFAEYHELVTLEELKERLKARAMYGAFVTSEQGEEKLAGFIGTHSEGALGMLQVRPQYRGHGIGAALESFLINQALTRGEIPFGHIFEGNEASLRLQKKLKLNVTDVVLWWVS
ncbi:MAG: GNAT family N-acetyltransferase [Lachnospiraceae bacterium]|nr:GNAT family N-acetyltransferase [Lachnospiraceae bacterium]